MWEACKLMKRRALRGLVRSGSRAEILHEYLRAASMGYDPPATRRYSIPRRLTARRILLLGCTTGSRRSRRTHPRVLDTHYLWTWRLPAVNNPPFAAKALLS